MLISNVHRSMIVMNSLDARFSKNFFEAVQDSQATPRGFKSDKTLQLVF